MRVIHVITRLIVGGAQENTIASVLGLRRFPGLQVELMAGPSQGPEGSLQPLVDSQPGLLIQIPELVRPVAPLKDWLALGRLTREFRVRKPQVVHTHSGKAGLLGRAAAVRANVPIIVHTIHGPSFGPFLNPFGNLLFRGAEQWAGRRTTHFVVVADAMKEQYRQAGIGRSEQYTRIFSGFPLGPFVAAGNDLKLRRKLGIEPEDVVVGKIARLFKLKGHDDLFAIAQGLVADVPRVKFLLIGDGEWRARFQEKARMMGMEERFVFTGLVSPAEVPAHIGICDMLVHLSRREGLPRALPQAMAAGRPVVAYDCDGAREVCIDNETGFLVLAGDKEALARRVVQLARDAALRERVGKRGQRFVLSRFSVDKMVRELHELYLKLLAGAGISRPEMNDSGSRL
jgi:glycosyltransferase involved in cell wall biosynthesis